MEYSRRKHSPEGGGPTSALEKSARESKPPCVRSITPPSLEQVGRFRTQAPTWPSHSLTSLELEVVAAVVAGYTNCEIARNLSLSEKRIADVLSSSLDALGVCDRLELVLFAIEYDLLDCA